MERGMFCKMCGTPLEQKGWVFPGSGKGDPVVILCKQCAVASGRYCEKHCRATKDSFCRSCFEEEVERLTQEGAGRKYLELLRQHLSPQEFTLLCHASKYVVHAVGYNLSPHEVQQRFLLLQCVSRAMRQRTSIDAVIQQIIDAQSVDSIVDRHTAQQWSNALRDSGKYLHALQLGLPRDEYQLLCAWGDWLGSSLLGEPWDVGVLWVIVSEGAARGRPKRTNEEIIEALIAAQRVDEIVPSFWAKAWRLLPEQEKALLN